MIDLVTRLLLELDGAGITKRDWLFAIGPEPFDRLCKTGILEGPNGATEVRCFNCDEAGHIAPVVQIDEIYHLYCQQAGPVALHSAEVELYHVSRHNLFIEIARAFEVSTPEQEIRALTDRLHFLGRAHLGTAPFSLMVAVRVRTKDALDDLIRRNREGFGQEKGVILVVDEILSTNTNAGMHEIVPATSVLDFDRKGFRPQWPEIRRLLGKAGRPRGRRTAVDEATERFLILIAERGDLPTGQAALRLFRERNLDLAHLKDSTLYAAKSRAHQS